MKDPEEEEWEAFKKEIAVEVAVAQDIQVWTLGGGVYFHENHIPFENMLSPQVLHLKKKFRIIREIKWFLGE